MYSYVSAGMCADVQVHACVYMYASICVHITILQEARYSVHMWLQRKDLRLPIRRSILMVAKVSSLSQMFGFHKSTISFS